jgi:SAM-dependent methyltransferase
MTEWRLYPDHDVPPVSTYEFHADRERAPHLEQSVHRDRLERARDFVVLAAGLILDAQRYREVITVSDLGCGDGGLLQLLGDVKGIDAWGYDFHPASQAGWAERGVRAEAVDVFGVEGGGIGGRGVLIGDIAVCTEVLEHIADPHKAVRWIAGQATYFVASSPATETDLSHDEAHAWAWDMEGYRALLEGAGFEIERHVQVGMFQVILGRSVYS